MPPKKVHAWIDKRGGDGDGVTNGFGWWSCKWF
jgi:hypothetical protein